MNRPQIFISYSGHDAFEANLLQYALESMLLDQGVTAWTFQRDQNRSESEIARSLKAQVKASAATVFLVSPATLNGGATQWMELAYADAFGVPTFILMHHLSYPDLKANDKSVPPLLLSSQCNAASDWRRLVEEIRELIAKGQES